jgi:hypothetical protein
MSWSLELRNGDLTLSGTHLGQVVNGNKLAQDLRCTIIEHRGHDDMHPTFGSVIDGGLDENGRSVESVVGVSDWSYAVLIIQSEIQRIAAEYQQRQLTRANDDRRKFGQSTLSNGELLVSVGNIGYTQAGDTLLVDVTLETGRGDTIQITMATEGWGILMDSQTVIHWNT